MSAVLDDPIREWDDDKLAHAYLGALGDREKARRLARSRWLWHETRNLLRCLRREMKRRGIVPPKYERVLPPLRRQA